MSIESRQREVTRYKKEIADLQKKDSDEAKLRDEDMRMLVGKKIANMILKPKFDSVFHLADRIFHRNFNLIDRTEEDLTKPSNGRAKDARR